MADSVIKETKKTRSGAQECDSGDNGDNGDSGDSGAEKTAGDLENIGDDGFGGNQEDTVK